MKYHVLIVDDERPALKLLTAYIKKLPHLQLIDTCENALEAIAALEKHKIDLLFLDIQMPDLTGLELLKAMKDKPQVVLCTAYREYAVEGFALDVTDYLVKPFSFERFVQAINKAIGQIKLEHQAAAPKTPLPSGTAVMTADHFFVRTNYKMEKVLYKDILYIEGMREYISIHTSAQRYVINQTMHKMSENLPADQFMRIHRSYIIGLRHIQSINGNQVVIENKNIPVGTSYRKVFFDKINLI